LSTTWADRHQVPVAWLPLPSCSPIPGRCFNPVRCQDEKVADHKISVWTTPLKIQK
jgi:hypothetical protein